MWRSNRRKIKALRKLALDWKNDTLVSMHEGIHNQRCANEVLKIIDGKKR